jgi:dipeptide/tripeptide permease
MSSDTNTGFFGHPRGLRTLFFTEMWERFSYYGMRAILILFMTNAIVDGGLGFGADKAGPIYAMYTSLVYLATVPGGWLADRFLGQRRSVLWGGTVIMLGHILLAMHGQTTFFSGLGCIVLGTGLLKPNISVIVGQLYTREDQRRDAGFSIFYMGINVGAFSAPLICGWLAQSDTFKGMLEGWGMSPTDSWHWGFGAAAVGMFFGLVQYVLTGRDLGTAGVRPLTPATAGDKRTLGIGFAALAIGAVALAYIDSHARYLDSISYESSAEGLLVSGTLRGAAEETAAVSDGAAFAAADVDKLLGEEAGVDLRVQVLTAEVAAGRARGTLEDEFLRVSDPELRVELLARYEVAGMESPDDLAARPGLAQELDALPQLRLTDIGFESVGGELAIRGRTLDQPAREVFLGRIAAADIEESFPKSIESLRAPIGKAVLEDAVAAGNARGTLTDQSVKLGGLNTTNIKEGFKWLLLLTVIAFFAKLFMTGDWTPSERARLVTIFVLFLGAAVFWGLFEQAGSTLTLFADQWTNNSILGLGFPSSWWQSLNALMIVLLAPFFAWLWVKLGKHNPSYPAKFAIGLSFAGLGFLVLVGGATAARSGALVSPLWLFSVYLLHTIGELFLSPVGLSSMTKLAPARVVSLMMGVWFLAASVGNYMAGSVAGYYEALPLTTLFAVVAGTGFVMALLMFSLVRPIKRMLARNPEPAAREAT